VLSDADIPAAAATAVKARYLNAGQSCVCAKRFIVESTVADEFTDAFVAGVEVLVVGNPAATGTQMGPVARADLRDAIARQVDQSAAKGARVLTGGATMPGPGYPHSTRKHSAHSRRSPSPRTRSTPPGWRTRHGSGSG
jgi:acyl-CoA reductase-like NAD-dependent aldehyde dehydrogenase